MYYFFILLFASSIPSCYFQEISCAADSQSYYTCISNQRITDPWSHRRPYRDYNTVVHCLNDAGCDSSLDYKRGMFVDFIKLWQNVANKVWNEYITTPEKIKQCIRLIVINSTRPRLDDCIRNLGGIPLDTYPEEFELPYCGLPMPTAKDEENMKAGLFERVNVLHAINSCREAKGDDVASKATQCVDNVRRVSAVNNFCNTSDSCIRTKNVSSSCSSSVAKTTSLMCQCAKTYRDQTIATIDRMYATGSVNLLKLFPVFLGLDLTLDVNAEMKKCYTDNGAKPISALNVIDNPILNGPLLSVQPRPQGIQAVRVLAYSQLDLPDICESCT